MNPGPLTLRELLWMAQGRVSDNWSHTASVLAMLANTHRPRNGRVFKPADFHPYAKGLWAQRGDAAPKDAAPKLKDLGILKTIFIDRRSPL